MAVVGILGTELLGVSPKWFEAGAKDYGVPMAPLILVLLCPLMHLFHGHGRHHHAGHDPDASKALPPKA